MTDQSYKIILFTAAFIFSIGLVAFVVKFIVLFIESESVKSIFPNLFEKIDATKIASAIEKTTPRLINIIFLLGFAISKPSPPGSSTCSISFLERL